MSTYRFSFLQKILVREGSSRRARMGRKFCAATTPRVALLSGLLWNQARPDALPQARAFRQNLPDSGDENIRELPPCQLHKRCNFLYNFSCKRCCEMRRWAGQPEGLSKVPSPWGRGLRARQERGAVPVLKPASKETRR